MRCNWVMAISYKFRHLYWFPLLLFSASSPCSPLLCYGFCCCIVPHGHFFMSIRSFRSPIGNVCELFIDDSNFISERPFISHPLTDSIDSPAFFNSRSESEDSMWGISFRSVRAEGGGGGGMKFPMDQRATFLATNCP